jgi:hypothetical protein
MAHVTIVFQSMRVVTQYTLKSLQHAIGRTLQCLERAGARFVISYDFRICAPSPQIAQAFWQLHQEHAEQFSKQLKSIVLLVADNLFTLACQGTLGTFLKAVRLPKCPRAIFHRGDIAKEFFRELLLGSDERTADFVAVARINKAAKNEPGVAETCVATLSPMEGSQEATDSRIKADVAYVAQHLPILYRLDNGDVRVIQSVANDVMLQQQLAPAMTDVAKVGSPKSDLQALEALKFRCPLVKLQPFVGTHFHVGELAIDADAISSVCGPTRKGLEPSKPRKPGNLESAVKPPKQITPGIVTFCLVGVIKMLKAEQWFV